MFCKLFCSFLSTLKGSFYKETKNARNSKFVDKYKRLKMRYEFYDICRHKIYDNNYKGPEGKMETYCCKVLTSYVKSCDMI